MTRVLATLAALFTLLTLVACGNAHSAASPAYDATVRSAKCADWRSASAKEKDRLVSGMRAFFGARVDGVQRGQVLSPSRTRAVFSSYCSRTFAEEFQLYRIYGNAAGFAGHGG